MLQNPTLSPVPPGAQGDWEKAWGSLVGLDVILETGLGKMAPPVLNLVSLVGGWAGVKVNYRGFLAII